MSDKEFYELLASDHLETYDSMTGDFYSMDDISYQRQISSYEDDQELPF